MIEIKHDGPTMVVSQDNLADATKDGTWRLLATYATTVKETIYGKRLAARRGLCARLWQQTLRVPALPRDRRGVVNLAAPE